MHINNLYDTIVYINSFNKKKGEIVLYKIKSKEGSIIIGLMLLVSIIILLFAFAYETALLFIAKNKSDNVTQNISSSLILNIDKNKAKKGIIDINKIEGEKIAEKILKNSYKKSSIFEKPLIGFAYINKNQNEVQVTVTIQLPLKKQLIYFKNVTIKSQSRYRVYSKIDLKNLTPEELNKMTWKEIWDLLAFEEVL